MALPPEQGRVLGLSELAEWHLGLWARGWRIAPDWACGDWPFLGTSASCCSGAAFLAPGLSNGYQWTQLGQCTVVGNREACVRSVMTVQVGFGPSAVAPGSVTMALGGGGAFAASPLHGAAIAGGRQAYWNHESNSGRPRQRYRHDSRNGDMSHLPGWTLQLTSAVR